MQRISIAIQKEMLLASFGFKLSRGIKYSVNNSFRLTYNLSFFSYTLAKHTSLIHNVSDYITLFLTKLFLQNSICLQLVCLILFIQ